MSLNIIVLAKQVPDTRNVGKDAMKEDGTINPVSYTHLKFAIVTVGRINNIGELEKELLAKGHHFCEHSYDIINPTEMIAALICEGSDYVTGINNVYNLSLIHISSRVIDGLSPFLAILSISSINTMPRSAFATS